jgi:hypothetical protein
VPGQYQFMYGFCRICRAEFEKRGLETRDADVVISYWDYKQEKDWKFPVPAYWVPTEKVWGKKPLPLNTEAADYHAWAFERSINWAPGGTPDERWEYSRVLQRLTLRWADELKPEGPLRWEPLSALEERHVDGPIFDDEHQPWGFRPRPAPYEDVPEPLHPNDPKNKPPYKSRWMPEFRIYTSHADVEAMQKHQKWVRRSIRQRTRREVKASFPFSAETMPGSDEECSDDSDYQPPQPTSPTSPTMDLSPDFLLKLKEEYAGQIEDDGDVSDFSLRPANLPTAASSSDHTNPAPPPTIIHTVAAFASFKAMSSRTRPHAGAIGIDTSDSDTDDGYSSEELPLFPSLDEIADEARGEVEHETKLGGKGKGKEVDASIREEGPAETGGEGEGGDYGDYGDYDEDEISDEDESSDDEPYLSPSLATIDEVPEVEGDVKDEVKDYASETEEADPVPEHETEKPELAGDVEQASEDVSDEISEEAAEKKLSEETPKETSKEASEDTA